MPRPLGREDYTVGWVCALSIELAAAAEMLDKEHETPFLEGHETNSYTFGHIGDHNVVLACLPTGQTGTNSAAAVAMQLKSTFRSIRFGLMVGIGGGVPSENMDIRLGDVVVSIPEGRHGGVVEYDFGKATSSGFHRTGSLNTPPMILLSAVNTLQSNHSRGRTRLQEYLPDANRLPGFRREAAGVDTLFEAEYEHKGGATCDKCSRDRSVFREVRRQDVVVHYGTIASGNQVMKDACERDRLSAELGGVLCFEMEAAGLMNSFPCLVIRGIFDYADSHKNDQWQAYAAGTAAAYAKELLLAIPNAGVLEQTVLHDALGDPTDSRRPVERILSGEEKWERVMKLRWDEGRCLNCGDSYHWLDYCNKKCGRYSTRHKAPNCGYRVRCGLCKRSGHMNEDCWMRKHT